MIDPHAHLRDWNQAEKETLDHGLSVAEAAGISAVFEMPNTDPPLTTRALLEKRIRQADEVRERLNLSIFHGIYAGLTSDPDQIEEVVRSHREMFPRVVGLKLYAGHSTGNMGVTETASQRAVWEELTRRGYRGVVAVHAEMEALLRPDLRRTGDVKTHGQSRPAAAEVTSIQTQLLLAEGAGFRGTLHICHVSTPDSVRIVLSQRAGLPYRVTMGVTPHHLLLSEAHLESSPHLAVNPPLRSEEDRRAMVRFLVDGAIDWIESDHAPHTIDDKGRGASGFPGFPGLRLLRDSLAQSELSGDRIASITGDSVLGAFEIDRSVIPRPRTAAGYHELAREYPWDPFDSVALDGISWTV